VKTRRRDFHIDQPRRAREDDVDALNRVFADSFTDRYRRDGLVGVRVPKLNPDIWRYALRDAADGALLWCDDKDHILAFNIAHHSGTEGWMGPLAVRTDVQGHGLGRLVVQHAIEWLKARDVTTIGLETMPRTVDNIGFYSQLGFLPGYLTVTAVGQGAGAGAGGGPDRGRYVSVSELSPADGDAIRAACRERLQRSVPGLDFTRELELTQELGIGDAVVLEGGDVRGFALWHSAALVESRPADELRLLKLYADSPETFEALLAALEDCARRMGLHRVAVRCQTGFHAAYRCLVDRGYRVRWTDLRMTLRDYPAPATSEEGEIVFSNWEI
jgi:GNAT superfamily N-acetyltransferase